MSLQRFDGSLVASSVASAPFLSSPKASPAVRRHYRASPRRNLDATNPLCIHPDAAWAPIPNSPNPPQPLSTRTPNQQASNANVSILPISQSIRDAIASVSRLPVECPSHSADRDHALQSFLQFRATVAQLLDAMSLQANRTEIELDDAVRKVAVLQGELNELNRKSSEATDYTMAMDERVAELKKELVTAHNNRKQECEQYELRLSQVVARLTNQPADSAVTQKILEQSRNEQIRRLEEENRELRAHLQRADSTMTELAALKERCERLVTENNTANANLSEATKKNETLVVELRAFIAKTQQDHAQHEAVQRQLLSEVSKAQQRGGPKHRNAAAQYINATTTRCLRLRFFETWKLYARERTAQNAVARFSRSLSSERQAAKEKEEQRFTEKLETQKLMEELSQRVEKTRKDNVSLKEQCAKLQEALEQRPVGRGSPTSSASPLSTSGITTEELQVKAMEAYNVLFPVLQGIKRRLHLHNLKTPPLRMFTNTTEHVIVVVVNWIREYYKFIHTLLSVDDRFAKAKSKLAFLSIQVRSDLKKILRKLDRKLSVPAKEVLQLQKQGLSEMVKKICALRSRIDATRTSMFSNVDASQQKELESLASNFEVDLQEFNRVMKANQAMQFQLSVRLSRLVEAKVRDGNGASLAMSLIAVDSASRLHEHLTSESNASSKAMPGGMIVGSVIAVDSRTGLILDQSFRQLVESEAEAMKLRRRLAVSPELLEHRLRMKRDATKRRGEQRLLTGGYELLKTYSGAVIPFRACAARPTLDLVIQPKAASPAQKILTRAETKKHVQP